MRITKQLSNGWTSFEKHFNRTANTRWKNLIFFEYRLDQGKSIISDHRAKNRELHDGTQDEYADADIESFPWPWFPQETARPLYQEPNDDDRFSQKCFLEVAFKERILIGKMENHISTPSKKHSSALGITRSNSKKAIFYVIRT